jgi:anti-anti-sigma factor
MSTITYADVGDDLRRIIIAGRLDSTGANSIAARLMELAGGRKKAVVVDLSDVQLLASTGLGALIASAKAVKTHGGKMVLVVNGSNVMMSLQATGVDKLIPVFRTVADAESAARA